MITQLHKKEVRWSTRGRGTYTNQTILDKCTMHINNPPLVYYYSIINFTNPDKVIFVGEDVNRDPVWDAFEDLQFFGMTKFAIELQSSDLWEDLDTMLRARNIVESVSLLMAVVRLGFAQRFTPHAVHRSAFPAQQVYFVNSGKYGAGRHNNVAEEWAVMLLRGKAFPPRLCNA
jgi:hypothetical protein